ncbi:MAG TPA: pyridoxal 5'-phosphate synthase glutaminase subunit PdxT [Egibacteraceae bacterium]|nr:pyridoxal 5'-phosphate synthase glutaminase subunit PdxT [Egibacteraceae bacterium]
MDERIPGEALAGGAVAPPAGSGAPRIGVLALQGDVLEHVRMLRGAGAEVVVVKRPEQLESLAGLVIPGGESTTIGKLAEMYGLLEPLRKRISEGLPAFGTCAGAILLSRQALAHDGSPSPQPLIGVLEATTRRNAFGRQVASFEADLEVAGLDGAPLHAVFIRAPWFEQVGDGVSVLASVATPAGDKVVVVQAGTVLASAFHPELTGDDRLHRMFVDMVRAAG